MDYYDILGVSDKGAPVEVIRKCYKEQVLKHHPDKSAGGNSEKEQFVLIQKAWEVLSDDTRRKEHDKQLEEIALKQQLPLYMEMDIEEMEWFESSETLETVCRCGGRYILQEKDVVEGVQVIPCNNCTFVVKVSNSPEE